MRLFYWHFGPRRVMPCWTDLGFPYQFNSAESRLRWITSKVGKKQAQPASKRALVLIANPSQLMMIPPLKKGVLQDSTHVCAGCQRRLFLKVFSSQCFCSFKLNPCGLKFSLSPAFLFVLSDICFILMRLPVCFQP